MGDQRPRGVVSFITYSDKETAVNLPASHPSKREIGLSESEAGRKGRIRSSRE
uniref:Uncharacterized protein n=1 Tax=Cucumis melo TaxID=3656 RepID=A0A9I9E1S5_CUCME